jgi:hypothetical protein
MPIYLSTERAFKAAANRRGLTIIWRADDIRHSPAYHLMVN